MRDDESSATATAAASVVVRRRATMEDGRYLFYYTSGAHTRDSVNHHSSEAPIHEAHSSPVAAEENIEGRGDTVAEKTRV